MSVFFEGNAFIDGGAVRNVTIGNSFIQTTSIDMLSSSGNLQNITNVKDPIQDQDAATKKYVDQKSYINLDIELTGIEPTFLINNLSGSLDVTIQYYTTYYTNNDINFSPPLAKFKISKNVPTQYPHIIREIGIPAENTGEFLNITWNPNSGVYINKTGINYDGQYKVKIIL